ncbi:hypothetical protein CEXT_165051 [Caerostris extrusa]|uniref:Uncharacterized protein n=1 Tax=Caerostris extrusa TaxID=172846 RepID=A0AAV4MNL5_CAEEX|nr:hypothetical protein CEXT_165051 [Caerostris extrusa]
MTWGIISVIYSHWNIRPLKSKDARWFNPSAVHRQWKHYQSPNFDIQKVQPRKEKEQDTCWYLLSSIRLCLTSVSKLLNGRYLRWTTLTGKIVIRAFKESRNVNMQITGGLLSSVTNPNLYSKAMTELC